jgi:2-keto-3-deoxy-6-phosphogluconate aldolase
VHEHYYLLSDILSVQIVPLGGCRLRAVHDWCVSGSVCLGLGLDALVHEVLVVVREIY